MSRNKKLREQLRQHAPKRVEAPQRQEDTSHDDANEENANPLDAIMGDAALAEQEEIQDDFANGGEVEPSQEGGENDGESEQQGDPLAVLQKQYEELQARNREYQDQLKAKEEAESRYRSDYERERQEREAAEAKRREAEKERAEFQWKYQREELEKHTKVLEHALAGANAEIELAKRSYAEAMANMDYAAAADAQDKLAEARFKAGRLNEGYDLIRERLEASPSAPEPVEEPARTEPARQQPADEWEAAIANYSERDKTWLRKHKADLYQNERRQRLAQSVHNLATDRYGLQPGSDEYYQFMDEEMGYAEPSQDPEPDPEPVPVRQQAPKQAPQQRKAPVIPAAPPSRPSSGPLSSTAVALSPDEKATARALGMSFAKYAQYKQQIASGNTHLRFSQE